jgi:hypothetical protein
MLRLLRINGRLTDRFFISCAALSQSEPQQVKDFTVERPNVLRRREFERSA